MECLALWKALTCTSIEMTMELNRLPKVTNILVFQDHFTKHVMVYVTPNQTAKTVAMFLYQGYILIFGAPARLLSDCCANFFINIISKMCKLLSMKKLQTTPYHPQMNGLVDRSHQTIMWMHREAGRRWKSQLARSSGWNSACLQCHLISNDGVQPTLFDVWVQAKAPNQFLFPHLKECRSTQMKHLCPAYEWIHSHC